jgi:site-specific DNA recombinase
LEEAFVKPTALYVRVSSRNQAEEGSSLSTQEDAARAYAAAHLAPVAEEHVYRETFTGTELWERPELTRLRAAMARGEVGAVVAFAIDRLSRDPVHLGVILSEADHRGVDVHFVSETIDGTPEGQLVRFVRGYAAKIEHEKIRERTMRGRRARIASGKMMAGPRALYGYQWRDAEKTAYDVHPEHSLIVRRIWNDYAAGQSLRNMVDTFAAEGIPSPTGLPFWNRDAIRRILHHPHYLGEATAWGFQRPEGKARRFDAETAVELPAGTIPALVDRATWDRVQARLESNKHGAPCDRRIPAGVLLLRGHITCGECGATMQPEKYGNRGDGRPDAGLRYMYRCRHRNGTGQGCRVTSILADDIDQIAWTLVLRILTNPAIIAGELERMRGDDSTQRDLAAIDGALRDIGKQRANLTRAIAMIDDVETMEPLVAHLAQLTDRQRQLGTERDGIAERVANWEQTQTLLADFGDWGDLVASRAEELPWADRRALIERLGVKAIINRKTSAERYVLTTRFDGEELAAACGRIGKVSDTTTPVRHFPSILLRFSPTDLAAA